MEKSASTLNGSTYKGSFAFSSIADTAGMPIDQFNFLFSEVLALILAMIYRKVLPPRPSNRFIRHFVGKLKISINDTHTFDFKLFQRVFSVLVLHIFVLVLKFGMYSLNHSLSISLSALFLRNIRI